MNEEVNGLKYFHKIFLLFILVNYYCLLLIKSSFDLCVIC